MSNKYKYLIKVISITLNKRFILMKKKTTTNNKDTCTSDFHRFLKKNFLCTESDKQ